MISIQKIFGRDQVILDLLEASAQESLACSRNLNRLLNNWGEQSTLDEFVASRRKEKEIASELADRLVKTMVTTIDREDLEALSTALYKIPKTVEKFAERFFIVNRKVGKFDFTRQGYLVEQATAHVLDMIKALRKGANLEEIKEMNRLLQQVEGDADKLMLELMEELYSGQFDPLKVVALKDLYELLEKVIDRCRDAGNSISQIVYKYS
jgi:uncharacterized protein Yka (UPF0111/DUF47 family)